MGIFKVGIDSDLNKGIRLYNRYKNVMYSEAHKITGNADLTEEAVSEATARMIRNLHKIDENNHLRTMSYLVAIAKNAARKIMITHYMEVPHEQMPEDMHDQDSAEDLVIEREEVGYLIDIIKSMNPIYGDLILFKYVKDHTNREIADIMGISEATVRMRLSRAKKELQDELERRRENGKGQEKPE